jgi:ribosome biogenesis GTPase
MIAANIDVGFIMQSCDVDFNLRRLERYLIMIRDGNIEPVIVLTKSDLATGDKLSELIEKIKLVNIDCMVISLSNMTGEGLEILKSILISRKTYCLIGSSGVGKTTLLNNLIRNMYLKRRLFVNQMEEDTQLHIGIW